MDGVKLIDIVRAFDLEVVRSYDKLETTEITVADATRPGLQLAGSFLDFGPNRIQIIGNMEIAYIDSMETEERQASLDKLCSTGIPCLIISRNHIVRKEILDSSEKYKVPLLRSSIATSDLSSDIVQYLKNEMAPRVSVHGVLVEVHGEGILILGESGVGKSETALDIVKRGHRLIADDLVEIRKVSDAILLGRAPEIIRHLIEIRGLGILDIRELYGVSSVKIEEQIHFVVNLEAWDETKDYDRTGLYEEMTDILGVRVPSITIPVRPGRNMAVIVEVAAINFRQKSMGYNAAESLIERVFQESATSDVTVRREQIGHFTAEGSPEMTSEIIDSTRYALGAADSAGKTAENEEKAKND